MDESPTESDLVIATATSRILVIIKPDGRLIYGPEYTPDEAATVLWEALARRRAEAQQLVTAHAETLMLEVGRADLENEAAQLHAQALGGMGSQGSAAVLAAHRTNAALEQAVHRVIELGRSLALRALAEAPPTSTPSSPSSAN